MTAGMPVLRNDLPAGTILDHSGQVIEPSVSAMGLYEGASTGQRMGDWGLSSSGPGGDLNSASGLRRRARTLERNNPDAKKGIDTIVSNLVGTDITPDFNLKSEEQREELEERWEYSKSEVGFDGTYDFDGSVEQIARCMVRDGEGFGHLIDCPTSMGLTVPLQTRVLEGDHCDLAYNDISPEGNEIRHGIEYLNHRRYKFWMWDDHPGEMFLTSKQLERVPIPVEDMTHVFRPLRAGQSRGISWLAPIMVKLYDIDLYDDAEVNRKKMAAFLGGFLEESMPGGGARQSAHRDAAGKIKKVQVESGTFYIPPSGTKIAFSESADVGSNYEPFMKVQKRMVAAGFGGLTYEQLTGDLEGVNYTSLRAGLIEVRRLLETIIVRTLVFQYCRPFINRWIFSGVLNDCFETIKISEYLKSPRIFHRVDWHPHGWAFTDPVKDRIAEKMDIRNGFDDRGSVVGKRGKRIRTVDKKNRTQMSHAIGLGLAYDCYPNQTTNSGVVQKSEDKVNQKIEEKVMLDSATMS